MKTIEEIRAANPNAGCGIEYPCVFGALMRSLIGKRFPAIPWRSKVVGALQAEYGEVPQHVEQAVFGGISANDGGKIDDAWRYAGVVLDWVNEVTNVNG